MINMRKFLWTALAIPLCSMLLTAQETKKETRYDDWPVTRETNVRNSRFVLLGNTWDHNILTFFLENDTQDIAGIIEYGAIYDAMALWEAATNLRFLEVDNANDADFVMSWESWGHGDAGPFDGADGVLAHQLGGPAPNSFGAAAGDIHFDDSETWTLAIRNNGTQPIDLLTVAAHELGHALGLDHTTISGSLMLDTYNQSHRFLGSDDRNGIQSMYGAPQDDFFITGSEDICSGSQTYTLTEVPAAATVAWTTSANLTISGGTTGNSVNVSAVNPSATGTDGWIRATLTTTGGNLVLERDVNVGVPGRPSYITGPSHDLCEFNSTDYRYWVPAVPAATSYVWNWTGGFPFSITTTEPEIYINARFASAGTYTLSVQAQNSCGTSTSRSAAIFVRSSSSSQCGGCTGRLCFFVSSNKTDQNLIFIGAETGQDSAHEEATSQFLIYVYKNHNLILQKTGLIGENQLDLSNFPNGEYQIQLIHSQGVEKHDIIISR